MLNHATSENAMLYLQQAGPPAVEGDTFYFSIHFDQISAGSSLEYGGVVMLYPIRCLVLHWQPSGFIY